MEGQSQNNNHPSSKRGYNKKFQKAKKKKKNRNTVSNAHKMIHPAPPCFVFAYFTVGNLKINQI